MEVEEVPPSMEEENEGGEQLRTVDLGASQQQQPKLSFEQDESGEDSDTAYNNSDPPGADSGAVASSSNHFELEGTELHRRVRTGSAGANFKEWGMQQVKITRQVLSERFGRALRTVDPELEKRLNSLRDTQRKYNHLISLAGQFELHFLNVVETQKSLAEHFAFLSIRDPDLTTEFTFNSDAQKKIARNGETLLASVKFFIANVSTVASRSIEDTLATAKNYEATRVLFDAYRTEMEALNRTAASNASAAAKLQLTKNEFEKHKKKFEALRNDLDIKLKLLDENRVSFSKPPISSSYLFFLIPRVYAL